jgi:phosphoglycerate dehydrogenase-like enzyme
VSDPRVLVYRATEDDRPPGIEAAEVEMRYAPDAAALAEGITDAEVLFFYRADKRDLAAAYPRGRDLRWIQTASAGVDGLLFPDLIGSDVVVTNARGVFDDAIAEWTVGAMLAFATGIVTSLVDQGDRRWNDDRHTRRLAGTRLLVVGPGPIGRAVARRARDLGMDVAAVGTRERDDADLGHVHGPETFYEALADADHVVDTLPLTNGTRGLFDAAAFTAMRAGARFYNVGRGATVDEPALVEALRDGRVGGAALDVFEEEPLPVDSPLWSMPNVIVSPHICGDYEGWERDVVRVFTDNLARYVRGEPLRNLVDKARGHGAG